jgi:threonine/homoserine/homoserine lactone efflux protein
LPGFIQTGHASPTIQALILGGVHIAVSIVVHGAIVLSSDGLARRIISTGASPVTRRLFALALAGTAIWIGIETGR